MTEILNKYGQISIDTPFVVVVKDSVEGDMTFSFMLKEDDKNLSYTTYDVKNEHEAILTISNVKGDGVQSNNPILVGIYSGEYLLFVSFVIFAQKMVNGALRFVL